jgi:hypothetical protein
MKCSECPKRRSCFLRLWRSRLGLTWLCYYELENSSMRNERYGNTRLARNKIDLWRRFYRFLNSRLYNNKIGTINLYEKKNKNKKRS